MKRKTTKDPIKLRALVVGIFFTLFIAVILAKAVDMQIIQRDWLSAKAVRQYQRPVEAKGKRGIIYDTNYRELAITLDTDSIGAHPGRIKKKKETAGKLAKVLGLSRKRLSRDISTDRNFVWIKRQVTPREKAGVKALNIDGIVFVPEYRRFYPNRTLACQALGFSGIDGNGLYGLESAYNRYLEGEKEKFTIFRDAKGKSFDGAKNRFESRAGHNIILTIDEKIQYAAEQYLAEAVNEFHGKSGMALVMNPHSGEVLAMANYPFFNPNVFHKHDKSTWRNRTITDPFEPGSTMKIFTAAAALESGLLSANSIFYCENGKGYKVGPKRFRDTHDYGWLTVHRIVQFSSNIGAVKIGEILGGKIIYENLRRFGFGERTGIDAPGETGGMLSSYQRWTPIDRSAISFGQGISASALQVVVAASAIANGGDLMRPFLVKAVTDADGRLVRKTEPKIVRRAVSPETAGQVLEMMRDVVEDGTGTNAKMVRYSVSGKTGTAQKIGPEGTYAKGKYVASFLGMFPSDNPEVVILVVVDEPTPRYYGGTVSAPVFKKIAVDVADYLDIPPGNPAEELKTVRLPEGTG